MGGWTWAGRWFTQPSKHHGSCFLPHAVSTLPIHLARCRPPSLAICVVSHEWLSYTQSIIFTGRCCCDISKVTTGNTLIFLAVCWEEIKSTWLCLLSFLKVCTFVVSFIIERRDPLEVSACWNAAFACCCRLSTRSHTGKNWLKLNPFAQKLYHKWLGNTTSIG